MHAEPGQQGQGQGQGQGRQLHMTPVQALQQQAAAATIARRVSITEQVLKARNSEHELQGLQVVVIIILVIISVIMAS